jgi:hypothetical protein
MAVKKLKKMNNKYPPWHVVEGKIKKEEDWLRSSITTFSSKESYEPKTCRECLIRNIAILIVSGEVNAKEIKKESSLNSFWFDKKLSKEKRIYHSKEWQKRKMEKIENHFIYQEYKVFREPNLNWGRADLKIIKKNNLPLYIEVGTTSFFKLWINLKRMDNFIYLIVPNDDKLIEFSRYN